MKVPRGAALLGVMLFSAYLAGAQGVSPVYSWTKESSREQSITERIPAPPGFHRVPSNKGSYADWLRNLPLKPGCPPVMLYSGEEKIRQDVHVAVVDIDVGEKDLQQCADAVIRLRAEYLYGTGHRDKISFNFTSGDPAPYAQWAKGFRPMVDGRNVRWIQKAESREDYSTFREYLDKVFTYAGSYSLSKELVPVPTASQMNIGDVFVEGGFPGHAVMVVDMAETASGEKAFLLAQSYMPAQDIHVLVNPKDSDLSPWYRLDFAGSLQTPQWEFTSNDLMRFAEAPAGPTGSLVPQNTEFEAERPHTIESGDTLGALVEEYYGMRDEVNWEEFLGAADPVWERFPEQWWEAPYLGNGMMGTLIRKLEERTLEWQVGRSDVEDHRLINYGMGRLPIGSFLLHTNGELTGCEMRLNLLHAEAAGRIHTSLGEIMFRTIVHADQMAILVLWKGQGGEAGSALEWSPKEALHPRLAMKPDPEYKKTWSPNPAGYASEVDGAPVWVQPLSDGAYATAWIEGERDGWRALYISTQYAWPGEPSDVAAQAAHEARLASDTPLETFIERHRAEWLDHYRKSFLSLPDPYWQSFYWNQIYKLRAATRQGGVVLGIQGPWDQPTPWPGIWWNLNVQLTYWPMYTSNHLELAEPLPNSLREYLPNLIANVPPEYQHDSAGIYRSSTTRLVGGVFYPSLAGVPGEEGRPEVGDLLWACHNVWLHYRMSMDEDLLRETLHPVLRRAVSYYLHFLEEGQDGRLHLPRTYSPEYKTGPDCNYDLALLRWGAQALLRITKRLGLEDPLASEWRHIVDTLTDFPEGEQGFLIARDLPLDSSHRHYSHLLMVYPLYEVNVEQPDGEMRIRRSLDHWHSFPDALFGYSFTGGASISAAIGDSERALEYLNALKRFIEPNTMYREAGPVIETPLSAAQSIHDMLLQSWDAADGPLIRVFPATPEAWGDVVFHRWRAEGGFLLSAARCAGKTAWVAVTSLAGEPCRVRADFTGPPRLLAGGGVSIKATGQNKYEIILGKGEDVLLTDPVWDGEPVVAPVDGAMPTAPIYGLKRLEETQR